MELTRAQQFDQLARIMGSDKAEPNPINNPSGHGYMKYYAEHLPETAMYLLEIGCYKGASLKMWDRIYNLKCDIHCIDLFLNPELMSERECRESGFVPHQGDQGDITFLEGIKKQFDVIIDDGSHNAHHQLISFKQLFRYNLKSGGIYVIEDLHCNFDRYYYSDMINDFNHTPLAMLHKYNDLGKEINNPYFEDHEARQIESMIEWVKIYDDTIAFIKRK